MILSVCGNPNVLRVIQIVKIIITIIKIVVPIGLIVRCMLDYMSAVSDSDNSALNKTNKIVVKRLIAATLIFFIPTFVNIIADITENDLEYSSCITNATSENIRAAFINYATNHIDNAKNSLTESDYNIALNYINNNIKDENDKQALLSKLDTAKSYIDLKTAIVKLKKNYDDDTYKKVRESVEGITDSDVKTILENELKQISIAEGTPDGKKENSSTLSYVVHTPTYIQPNMPLIMYLHGDGGGNDSGASPFLSAAKKYYGGEIPFILVTPNGGMWAETDGRVEELKSIIDTVCEEYKCNKSRIGITGHSRGSTGVWHMVHNNPKFFYSAVPVSCGSYMIHYDNFVGTKIRAYAGTVGSSEQRYNSEMESIVLGIKEAGGDATFYSVEGADHGSTPNYAYTKETLDWMIN